MFDNADMAGLSLLRDNYFVHKTRHVYKLGGTASQGIMEWGGRRSDIYRFRKPQTRNKVKSRNATFTEVLPRSTAPVGYEGDLETTKEALQSSRAFHLITLDCYLHLEEKQTLLPTPVTMVHRSGRAHLKREIEGMHPFQRIGICT